MLSRAVTLWESQAAALGLFPSEHERQRHGKGHDDGRNQERDPVAAGERVGSGRAGVAK